MRTVVVKVDIPSGGRQGDVRTALLQALRGLPVPANLQDLTKATTLFSDVQATRDDIGQISWTYLDRMATTKDGDLKPIEERRQLSTSLTTFTCTIAAFPVAAPATEAAK